MKPMEFKLRLQYFFESHSTRIQIVVLILLPCIVFYNTLHNEIHLDGIYGILKNTEIQKIGPIWRHFFDPYTISSLDRITQYRPLLPLSFSINYALAGGHSLAAYHITNILLQIIAGVLVFFVCRELLQIPKTKAWDLSSKSSVIPFLVAATFTVHPVSAIPVNYIFARDVILAYIFMTGSLLVYLRMRHSRDSVIGWALALFLFLCALLSKTTSVTLPALVLLLEFSLLSRNIKTPATYVRVVPFVVLPLMVFAFTKFVLDFSDLDQAVDLHGRSMLAGAMTQADIHLFHYLRNFFWPFYIRLLPAVENSGPFVEARWLIGIAFLIATIIFAFRQLKRHPLIFFSILAYWIVLSPTSSFIPLYYQAAYYRPYPAIAFLLLVLAVLVLPKLSERARWGVVAIVISYFSIASIYLNTTYRTEETLWTQSVRYGGHATAHMNLAMSINDRNDPRVGEHLQAVLRMNPNYVLANINMGLYLINRGDHREGLDLLEKAAELAPSWAQSHYWLAKAYSQLGKKPQAYASAVRAATLAPRDLEYQYDAARYCQDEKKFAQSLKYLSIIEQRNPRFRRTLFMKGFALQMLDRTAEAIRAYRQSLGVENDYYQTHFNLAYACMASDNYTEAIYHFQKTLTYKPDYTEVHDHLQKCIHALEKKIDGASDQ